ncbi:MAG: hypothetical protein QF473_09315 [Planctomycetota bacterium]|jgi:hypothetical protein|nr:hypothetical protein [Planctomycetota bacterium]
MADQSRDSDLSGGAEPDHPLALLTRMTPGSIELLRGRWIDSVEGFVGMTADAQARTSTCTLLGLDADEFDMLLAEARDLLGPEMFEKYSTPIPGGRRGVVWTDEERKQAGLD